MGKLKFYSDPGHGWLEVPVSELAELEILGKVSPYSYVKPSTGMAYLEEDCDLSLFVKACGIDPSSFSMFISEVNTEEYSWIRNLPSISTIQ